MRRSLLLLTGALLSGAAVAGLERLDDEWRYQHLLTEGDTHMAAGNPAFATAAYSGALALRPDSMLGYYRRGEAYAAQGQTTQALRDLDEAARLAPDAPEPSEAIGRLHARAGDHRASALWYGEAVMRRPDADPRLLYALALAHYHTGALGQAHDAIQSALARDPSLAPGYYLQGLVARDLGQPREAISSLEYALRLDGSMSAARRELANLHASLGRHDRQAAELERLPGGGESTTRGAVAAALAHLSAGDVSLALARLRAITEASPGDSRVALALGRAALAVAEATANLKVRPPSAEATAASDSLDAARDALERALGGTVGRSEGLALYGRALHLSGQPEEAERLLLDALMTTPVFPPAFGYLADVAEQLGHPIPARDALIALTALEGSTVAGPALRARHLRIGRLSLRGRDGRTAIDYLRRSHRSDAPAIAALAEAHWLAGETAEARPLLTRLRAEAPDDPDVHRLDRLFD